MGFIDFVKSAGEKLFGGDDDKKEAAERAAEANAAAVAASRSRALVRAIQATQIPVEGLDVTVDGEVAKVEGTVNSQEDREKIVLILGNTAGIARVDDRLEVDEPAPAAQYYTVKSGDSLSKIAKEHYGNAMKYPVIFEANKPMLTDPDKIYPGQVLRIPPIDED